MPRHTHPAILRTKKWIEHIVIGLELCPFAKFPYDKDLIRYVITDARHEGELLELIHDELILLNHSAETIIETTLIILTEGWTDFMDYLDAIDLAEEVLERIDLEGVIQIASFHPDYNFEHLDSKDVRNYTNRSPYPMIHLIREDSVTSAVDSHPDIASVPEKNETTMLEKGLDFFETFNDSNN